MAMIRCSSEGNAAMTTRVLVVDDQQIPRGILASELAEAGFAVVEADDGADAWHKFRHEQPDVVVTDLEMPRSDGMELLARIRRHSEVPVIVFTAFGSVARAVSALKAGADEFVASEDIATTDLVGLVQQAIENQRASATPSSLLDLLPGSSEDISRVRERVQALASLESPVLVSGEPGSGRSRVIQALSAGCRDVGKTVLELDAREFTRAVPLDRVEVVWLRNIEKLAAASQEYWWHRVLPSDRILDHPRLLATTGTGFRGSVLRGEFRADLGRRLLDFEIRVPPLRDRQEDMKKIVSDQLHSIAMEVGRRPASLSGPALQFLREQPWPGNLRDLKRVLRRAVAFSRERIIRRRILEEICQETIISVAAIRGESSAQERENLLEALRIAGGNISRTASHLGRSRGAVYRLIAKHGIRLSSER